MYVQSSSVGMLTFAPPAVVQDRVAEYVQLVCDEVKATRALGNGPLDTVYFGGGVSMQGMQTLKLPALITSRSWLCTAGIYIYSCCNGYEGGTGEHISDFCLI